MEFKNMFSLGDSDDFALNACNHGNVPISLSQFEFMCESQFNPIDPALNPFKTGFNPYNVAPPASEEKIVRNGRDYIRLIIDTAKNDAPHKIRYVALSLIAKDSSIPKKQFVDNMLIDEKKHEKGANKKIIDFLTVECYENVDQAKSIAIIFYKYINQETIKEMNKLDFDKEHARVYLEVHKKYTNLDKPNKPDEEKE